MQILVRGLNTEVKPPEDYADLLLETPGKFQYDKSIRIFDQIGQKLTLWDKN